MVTPHNYPKVRCPKHPNLFSRGLKVFGALQVASPNLGSSVSNGWHSQYPKALGYIHSRDEVLHLSKMP